MRKVLLALALAAAVVPLAAQAPAKPMQSDPDNKVAGGGMLPAGWQARLDNPGAGMANVKAMEMMGGLHVVLGPAGIFYQPSKMGKGDFQAKATFNQLKLAAHPEAYGLFIGGSDLQGAGQKYTYFIIRQDGKFMIKRRNGAQTSTVVDWTDNAAVKKPGADGKVSNTLSVNATKDAVKFMVNGTEVASQPRANLDTEGVVGLRVNHNLEVHIADFAVSGGSTH